MPTAVRRAAWAEWAAWTCKEPRGSLQPGARRLAREDRRPPSGNRRGFFFCAVSNGTHLEGDRKTQSDARRPVRESLVAFRPSPLRRLHERNVENVFVESCRALGARGNGRSVTAPTHRSSRSRERRAHGEARSASHVFHEQEVRRPRSGIAVVAHSLIS